MNLGILSLAGLVLLPCVAAGLELSPEQTEFFEKKIRPVLVKRCYGCHNTKMPTALGGLRLDTRDGLLRGGDSGPALIAGDPGQSRLIRAITYQHDLKMPPTGKLPDQEIADLSAWVKMGAPDPREAAPAPVPATAKRYDFDEARKFWAFQPVTLPTLPTVQFKGWIQSPVDAFLLAKLESQGLQPAKPADRRTLLRRVTYDLTGLPPTPRELDDFLNDMSAKPFEKVVDRLLASPHYGERWARHWMDLVRYAETNGHEYDNDKHDPWRYRDYLIRAFNDDVPYDQLVREHIAGDLLTKPRLRSDAQAWESPLGTTFFWFGEVLNSATDSEKSRADDVDNQIDVAAKTFLGLTVACARCHDHKFDPIPTADYYALAGVFHSTELREASIDSPSRTARLRELSAKILRQRPAPVLGPAELKLRPEDKPFETTWIPQGLAFGDPPAKNTVDSRSAGSVAFSGTLTTPKFRTGKELYLHVRLAGTKGEAGMRERGPLRFTSVCDGYKGQTIVSEGQVAPSWKRLTLTFERDRICYFEVIDRSRDGYIAVSNIVFSSLPTPPEAIDAVPATGAPDATPYDAEVADSEFAMLAEDRDPHNVKLHIRGNHKNLGEEVPRRFLQVVAGENQPAVGRGSGRLEIADWMSSSKNPLTARVMVNRIWKHHFGYGLVRSTDNFGKMGEAPTHPELLDYLASGFVASGWSIKAMHRAILLSSAYQMSSEASEQARQMDPANKLLQHMPVRRLEAEAVRDTMLVLSGGLDPTLYGPSIPPHISSYQDGRGKPKSGPLDGDGRRSIYIQVRRNFMTPMFVAFDYPSPISAIGARTVSTVPSQALLMMNNEFVAQQASLWASRNGGTPEQKVQQMFVAAFARPAESKEVAEIVAFLQSQKARPENEVWADVAHVLFNSAEFLYVP